MRDLSLETQARRPFGETQRNKAVRGYNAAIRTFQGRKEVYSPFGCRGQMRGTGCLVSLRGADLVFLGSWRIPRRGVGLSRPIN